MAYVSPSTNIVLLKNCILQKSENNETDTISWSQIDDQTNAFNGSGSPVATSPLWSEKRTYLNNTYQNIKAGVLRLSAKMSEVYGCNYMYFTNADSNFENKRYYCFIDNITAVNLNCVEVSYSIDYIQTFYFDYEEQTCLVERMTTGDDTVGSYVLDEGLDLGRELVLNAYDRKPFDGTWNYAIIFSSKSSVATDTVLQLSNGTVGETSKVGVFIGTKTITNGSTHYTTADQFWELQFSDVQSQLDGKMTTPLYLNTGVIVYDVVGNAGNLAPTSFYAANAPVISSTGTPHTFGDNNTYMSQLYGGDSVYDNEAYARLLRGVIDIAIFPNFFTTGDGGGTVDYGKIHTATNKEITRPSSLDGYTPKNNKLLTYPYIFLNVLTPNGDNAGYRYEWFNSNVEFALECAVLPSVQCLLSPVDYKKYKGKITGQTDDKKARDIGLYISDFPKTPLFTDSFKTYMGKNKYRDLFSIVNAVTSSTVDVLSSGFNFSIGNVAGGFSMGMSALSSVYNTAAGLISNRYDARLLPDGVIGQMGTGDIKTAENVFGYTFLGMSIDNEHAKSIDDFFTRYGYKIARHVNLNGKRRLRTFFTFIKTVECNIKIKDNKHMFQDDEQEIERVYNNGVRFWKWDSEHPHYKDYSVNNTIPSST